MQGDAHDSTECRQYRPQGKSDRRRSRIHANIGRDRTGGRADHRRRGGFGSRCDDDPRRRLSLGMGARWCRVEWKGIVPVKEQEADAITAKLTRSVACAAKELLKTAQIDVIGNLHLGVVIEIGELSLTVERTIRGVRFRQGIEDDRPFIEEVSLRDLAELWRSRQGPPRHGRILSETRSTWRPRSAPASDSRVTAASLV